MLYGAGFVHMAPGRAIPVLPFFNLVMVWNPGISYGLFPASAGLGTALLVGLFRGGGGGAWAGGCGVSTSRALAIGLGLVIGGRAREQPDRPAGLWQGGRFFPLLRLRL